MCWFCFFVIGNLWEELKDDSLAVDPLVLISTSPMSSQCFPSHCQMDSNSSSNNVTIQNSTTHNSLPDLHLTTLYSAFMELDTVSTAYMNNSGSKPIALVWTTNQPSYSYFCPNAVLTITLFYLLLAPSGKINQNYVYLNKNYLFFPELVCRKFKTTLILFVASFFKCWKKIWPTNLKSKWCWPIQPLIA